MALSTRQSMAPDTILPAGFRRALEQSRLGRVGLNVGRKIRRSLKNLRDPLQYKIWMRQFGLPARNAILLNRPLSISFDGISIRLEPRGATAADLWAGLRRKYHEVSFALSLLAPGMIFLDVGAGAGIFAISAAKKMGGDSVFAFEFCSSTRRLLRRNLELNRVDGVNVLQMSLGDATHPADRDHPCVTSVDSFMSDQGIPRVDMMKVDIEGAELILFRGARNLLERADAPVILYDSSNLLTRGFGYHPVEILWLLESCGYSLFSLSGKTGEISELKPDYQYDSMVIAAKPGNPAYAKLPARVA